MLIHKSVLLVLYQATDTMVYIIFHRALVIQLQFRAYFVIQLHCIRSPLFSIILHQCSIDSIWQMSSSETTRLHFELTSSLHSLKSPMFSSNNNNNNRNSRTKHYQMQSVMSNRKLISIKRGRKVSGLNVKTQSCSFTGPSSTLRNESLTFSNSSNLKDHSSLSLSLGESSDSAASDFSLSHPYVKEGQPKLRKPRRLSSTHNQLPSPLCSHSSHFSYISHLSQSSSLESPFTPNTDRSLEPDLTIAERKRLLMNTSPHLCRSLTPHELTPNTPPMFLNSDSEKDYESSSSYDPLLVTAETNSIESSTRFHMNPVESTSPTIAASTFDSISELEESMDKIKPIQAVTQRMLVVNPPDTCQQTSIRSKLSLSRRCSEATLPLSFSSKHHKTIKRTRKPRSNTSDSIIETPKVVAFNSSLESSSKDTIQSNEGVESFSPTRKLFLTSNTASKPRHSMYFLHSPSDFTPKPSKPRLHPTNGYLESCQVLESESENPTSSSMRKSQSNTLHSSVGARRLLDKEEPPSSLSESDATEDSFFGEDDKFHKLHAPEYTASPNQDSTHDSERYSLNNALDSQEYADISSSVDDITCASGDLSDSGCHTYGAATKHIPAQSVHKICLDLNQMKYVGLSLVGGADSPFGNLPVLVKEVMPNGAGERCGISRGDEIIGINNVSLEDKPLQFAVERLRQCSSRDQEIILWVIPQADSC